MKKTVLLLILLLTLVLVFGVAGACAEQASPQHLFGYVIGQTEGGFELITDGEAWYSFTTDEQTTVNAPEGLHEDDAVVVKYVGAMDVNAQAQSVAVAEIMVLDTLYGILEDAAMNTTTVRSLQEDGQLYIFSNDGADIVSTEDGIVVGDEVEVAFEGALQPGSDKVQQLGYVHITVYGQIEEDFE